MKTIPRGWMEINQLLQKDKILAGMVILNRFFRKNWLTEKKDFIMNIVVDEEENIKELEYKEIC